MKGTWYLIQGRFIDFDGKAFGFGSMEVEIQSYKGPARITSLPCFPIKYHKDHETLQKQLIERGNKFVTLAGLRHRFYLGLAFAKIEGEVVKVSVNSRVVIDPQTFRYTNPNYPISTVQPVEPDPFAAPRQNNDEQGSSSGDKIGLVEMKVEDDGDKATKRTVPSSLPLHWQYLSCFPSPWCVPARRRILPSWAAPLGNDARSATQKANRGERKDNTKVKNKSVA